MSKNDSKDSAQKPIGMEAYVSGGLLAAAAVHRVMPAVENFWNHHTLAIELGLGLGGTMALAAGGSKLWNSHVLKAEEDCVSGEDDTAVYLGVDLATGKKVYLRQTFRTMHTQVIGTTNAGKSESAIFPLAISDIKNGNGILLIDGKSDSGFLDKLYGYVCRHNREAQFKLFSLSHVGPSSSFNPLNGGSPQEVTERVFSSFTFENEYYRNVQYKIFLGIVKLIFAQKEVPTFRLVGDLLNDQELLAIWVQACPDEILKKEMTRFLSLPEKEREERISGLETAISHFTSSEVGILFDETDQRIDFTEAMNEGHILYFQLPTMLYPFLGSATGKLVLQSFQSAVSKRQVQLVG